MAEESIIDQIFASGGEMGRRMRAMDWSANPLGPAVGWPQSLKTCIRIILTSRQPMFVWWGSELINLYNDAYKAIVGGKHPAALGQPAAVVWREIWGQVGPRAEATMHANEGTYDESLLLIMERNGYQEETYYTFSYSPVPTDGGATGGILCANTDDTRQIIGERQLALLCELATRLAHARTAQAVIEVASRTLGTNPRDLPFSAIYLLSADRQELRRGGSTGIGPEHAAVPEHVRMDSSLGARLLDALERHESTVIDADPTVPLPAGTWPTPPRQIAYVPIAPSGETGRPGLLVVGLSPFRLFDAGYRGFLDLVAGQISAALANVQVHEENRRRAESLAALDRARTSPGADADPPILTGVPGLANAVLSSLSSHVPIGIALLRGPDHVYELCNPSYRQLVPGRQIVGKPVREALPELAGQGLFEVLDRVYATGEPYAERGLAVAVPRPELGRIDEVYIDFVCQPMPDASGTIGGVLVVVIDVTDQARARQRENAARTEAERANRAKDEFLAMLGHELRNPLAPILTAVELMRIRAPNIVQREVAVVERQAQHLVRLVEDLLDISRIARGKLDLNKERIELSHVVVRAIEQASPLIEQRKHDLRVNVSARGLALEADPDRLAQVIANLLTNAAKYTEVGGQITITAARTPKQMPERMIELKVRDTGIGIAPEMLPVVFDRFVQEPQALDRSQGGLGLGLAIVRSLVMLHGGSVYAHSAGRGQGAEFTILLPALDADDAGASPRATEPPVTAPLRSGLRILLVDDNEDYADMFAKALAVRGNRLRVAHNGPAALRIANEFTPDVAILDIGLPVMDGYELAQLLRQQRGGASLRLVAVTGYGQEGDKHRAQAAGFDAHLVKPIEVDHVEAVIRDLTAGRPGLTDDPVPR